MRLAEHSFHEYYHHYMVFEADALTERLKEKIPVTADDCFALCTNGVEKGGRLRFPVLSIGSSWDLYAKGLHHKQMLGTFEAEEVMGLDLKILPQPSFEMVQKGSRYFEEQETWADDELLRTRQDTRLDAVRFLAYPDIVLIGFMTDQSIQEYPVQMRDFNGPFAEGRLTVQPDLEGLHENDLVRALPYSIAGQVRLLAVFTGDHLSSEEEKAYQDLLQGGAREGFGFSVHSLKN